MPTSTFPRVCTAGAMAGVAIAELAEECSIALHCIGEAHGAAILVMQHQERLRRKLESKPKTTAKRRKKVKDSAAQWERSLGRFASHNANFKLLSRPFSSGMPCGWFAVHKENLSFLQPRDYKHTFLHSRLFMDRDEANISFKYDEIDAWKAAEVQRQIMKSYKIMQREIKDVMNKRKVLRGQLAGSKSMIEQKLQILERENHVIKRSEKENKRDTLRHQNVDILSKALSQGVEQPASPDLPQKVKDEASRKADQGLKLTSNVSCSSGQISILVENVQDDEKIADHGTTTFLSCHRELNRNGSSKLSRERASRENKSKLI